MLSKEKLKNYIGETRGNHTKEEDDYRVFDYKQPRIPVQRLYKDKKPLQISRRVLKQLVDAHKLYTQTTGYENVMCSFTDNQAPLIFLLGQRDNVVRAVELVDTDGCGCGVMEEVRARDIAKTMYKLVSRGYHPAAMARVGFFGQAINDCGFGEGLQNIASILKTQAFGFVSLGIKGFTVHYPDSEQFFRPHSYKIV